MKKLILTILGVSIVLVGCIAILNLINPFSQVSSSCATNMNNSECKKAKECCGKSEESVEKKMRITDGNDSVKYDSVRIKVRHPL